MCSRRFGVDGIGFHHVCSIWLSKACLDKTLSQVRPVSIYSDLVARLCGPWRFSWGCAANIPAVSGPRSTRRCSRWSGEEAWNGSGRREFCGRSAM